MTDAVVVDACVALKWFVAETDSPKALALLGTGLRLAAPDLVLVEVGNGLRNNARLGRIAPGIPSAAIDDVRRYFAALVPMSEVIDDALSLALAIDHAVYDCTYVIASRMLSRPLITTDERLIARLAGTPDAARVVHLNDWT